MRNGDVSSHLKASALHVRFEALIACEFGHTEVRQMVADSKPSRSRPNDPATPAAWAAAAGHRVAVGKSVGSVVAELGDLGVFCAALGSITLLAALPAQPGDTRLQLTRADLEAADTAVLRVWAVQLLPQLVDGFARLAPRWWLVRRHRFASMVLHRMASPDY
jgi:hypothetical protein